MTGGTIQKPSHTRNGTPAPISSRPTRWRTMGGYILFSLVVFSLSSLLAWFVVPQVLQGEFLDTDTYMRVVRAERLAETGAWYDNTIPRSNAPFGETLHWTRPLDVLLLAGALILRPVGGSLGGLHLSAAILSPLLLLLTCFGAGWAVVPLAGHRFRFLATIAVLAQFGIVAFSLPGRPDHHALLLLLFVVLAGFTIRGLESSNAARYALGAGIVGALGVWVSPEFLVPVGLTMGSGALVWMARGGRTSGWNLRFSMAFGAVLLLALLLERPPGDLLAEEHDRLSSVHLLVGAIAWAFWAVVVRAERVTAPTEGKRGLLRAPFGRLGVGMVGAVLSFGLLYLVFPKFFQGPLVDVDPQVWSVWLSKVGEYQASLVPGTVEGLGRALMYLGPILFCLPFACWVVLNERSSPTWGSWLYVALSFAAFLPLAVDKVRFAVYPEILIALVTVAIISRMRKGRVSETDTFGQALGRAFASAGMLVGFLLLGGAVMLMALPAAPSSGGREVGWTRSCPLRDLSEVLNASDGLGSRPRTILSQVDFGPEILYRTKHRVLATPYHRNRDGILGSYAILSAENPEASRRWMDDRQAELILLCPQHGSMYGEVSRDSSGEGVRLFDRLLLGQPPGWLRRVELPPHLQEKFFLYEVVAP